MKASSPTARTAALPELFAPRSPVMQVPLIAIPDAKVELREPAAPLSVAMHVLWPLPEQERATPPAVRGAQQGSRSAPSNWIRPVVFALLAGLGGELAGAALHGHADHSPHIEPREVEWRHRGARPPITARH